jgi:tRNA (guanine37-N1)-methyltransferase
MINKLIITIISLFPECIFSYFNISVLKRAVKNRILKVRQCQLRDFAFNKNKTVDDSPYGGGPGQLIRVDIVVRAIRASRIKNRREIVILLSPRGEIFKQDCVKKLSDYNHIIFICGRYEGIDSRVEKYVHKIYSIGDYILTGGELGAMIITDVLIRKIDGVLGNPKSVQTESLEDGFLEYNQYTKPLLFEKYKVPSYLLSGNHKRIAEIRNRERYIITKKMRPDLLI